MRFQNNNQEIIRKLTKKQLQKNKVRNLFVIAAIILTTFMISTVFSIGISFIDNYKIMKLRMAGSTAYISLNNPSEEQISEIEKLDIFDNIGYELSAGKVINNKSTNEKLGIILKYYDENSWNKQILPF